MWVLTLVQKEPLASIEKAKRDRTRSLIKRPRRNEERHVSPLSRMYS